MSSLTSLRLASLTTALSRGLGLVDRARSKCGGTTGRWAKLHLPRLTSYSSGALISRWPTAEVTTYCRSRSGRRACRTCRRGRQRAHDVLRDAGLLGNDERLGHGSGASAAAVRRRPYNPGSLARTHIHARAMNSMYRMNDEGASRRQDPPRPPTLPAGRRIQVRRSGVHGKGVFALHRPGRGGHRVHPGEVIDWPRRCAATRTTPAIPTTPSTSTSTRQHVIDAKVGGNAARWINHACDPTARPTRSTAASSSGAARHQTGRRALLRLRADHRRALHAQAEEAPATAARRKCRGTMRFPKR